MINYDNDLVLVNLFIGNDIHWIQIKGHTLEDRKINNSTVVNHHQFDLRTFLRNNVQTYSFFVDRLKSIPATRKLIVKMGFARKAPGLYVLEVLNKNVTHDYKRKWEQVFKYIKHIEQNSKKFALVVIPTKEQVYPERIKAICEQNQLNETNYVVNTPFSIIDTFASNNGIRTINLMDTLKKHTDKNLFFDIDPHFNELGHKISGEYIANQLKTDSLLYK